MKTKNALNLNDPKAYEAIRQVPPGRRIAVSWQKTKRFKDGTVKVGQRMYGTYERPVIVPHERKERIKVTAALRAKRAAERAAWAKLRGLLKDGR